MPPTNGEPARVKVPQEGRKPLLVVTDEQGCPVMNPPYYLAWHKGTGTYYVGGKEPRAYLRTRDRLRAIYRYREWLRVNACDLAASYVTVYHDPHRHAELAEPIRLVNVLDKNRPSVRYDVPAGDFWRLVREAALTDPETFRQETGLRIIDQGMNPPAALKRILDTYLAKRNLPSPDELKRLQTHWAFFLKAVAPAKTVQDVDSAALSCWEDIAYAKYNGTGSPKTLAHRFEYIQRVFRYAVKQQIDADECQRVVNEIVSIKTELPTLRNPNPCPIPVDVFKALLDAADIRWRAMLLTALNLAYYPVDIRTLTKDALNFTTGVVLFDRAKTGQTTRVGVLWEATKAALQAYMQAEPHKGRTVFITQYGKPYSGQGFRNTFRLLRAKAKIGSDVEFAHIRDGAYSAAIQGGATETIAKILAGHRIGGMSDAYVKRNPAMVEVACKAIGDYYGYK